MSRDPRHPRADRQAHWTRSHRPPLPAITSRPGPEAWRSACTRPSSRSGRPGCTRRSLRIAAETVAPRRPQFIKVAGRGRPHGPGAGRGKAGAGARLRLRAVQPRRAQRLVRRPVSSRTSRRLADVIPVMGFYLQPPLAGSRWLLVLAADGRDRGVVAIKMAPFNRYQTIDVVRGGGVLSAATRSPSTPATTTTSSPTCSPPTGSRSMASRREADRRRPARALGRLDRQAVAQLEACHAAVAADDGAAIADLLATGIQSPTATPPSSTSPTTSPAASPGLHEVLRRQGCSRALVPRPGGGSLAGQLEEIDRVVRGVPRS